MANPYRHNYDEEMTGEMMTFARRKRARSAVLLALPVILVLVGVFVYTGTMNHRYQEQIALGDKYFREGNYEQAEVAYSKAVAMNERKVEARERLALIKAVRGDYPGAREEYEKLYDMTQDESYQEAIRIIEQEEVPWFIVDPRTQPSDGRDDQQKQTPGDSSDSQTQTWSDENGSREFVELQEEDFPSFFGSGLTIHDMESVLDMLFGNLDWQTLDEADIDRIYASGLTRVLSRLMSAEVADDVESIDMGYRYTFDIDRINRRMAPITNFRYQPNQDYGGADRTYVFNEYTDDENVYIEVRATGVFSNYYSHITAAEYNDYEAVLYFTFEEWDGSGGYTGYTGSGEARFTRRADGVYKLTSVTIGE